MTSCWAALFCPVWLIGNSKSLIFDEKCYLILILCWPCIKIRLFITYLQIFLSVNRPKLDFVFLYILKIAGDPPTASVMNVSYLLTSRVINYLNDNVKNSKNKHLLIIICLSQKQKISQIEKYPVIQ